MSQAASDTTIDSTTDTTLFAELSSAANKLNKAARGALIQISNHGNDWFRELVKTGEAFRAQTTGNANTAKAKAQAEAADWRTRLTGMLGLPTREEMDSLDKKLNRISRKVNKLAREQKA